MRYIFYSLIVFLLCGTASAQEKTINFALLSDTHFNSFKYAEDDLRQAVADINASDSIDFVIISGDLVEFGETAEYKDYKNIIAKLMVPYHVVSGNHDTNWSENGCTAFDKFFGSTHFIFDYNGYRFIGLGAGPMLKMGAPYYPHKEIDWLKSVIDTTNTSVPIIFINHFPMDEPICNGHEVMQILKTRNLKLILSGHEHQNSRRLFEGVPGIVCRSILRRKDPIGGYNIVTLKDSTISFRERIIKTTTYNPWTTIDLTKYNHIIDPYPKNDTTSYSINKDYPQIIEKWRIEEQTDLPSQASVYKNKLIYTTTNGYIKARDIKTGIELWEFKTSNSIFSTPFITKKYVYTSSTDGFIYCLNHSDGSLKWKKDTRYPLVSSPLISNNILYIGSSNGHFYAINAYTGIEKWENDSIHGFVEARPCSDGTNVYFGTWGLNSTP